MDTVRGRSGSGRRRMRRTSVVAMLVGALVVMAAPGAVAGSDGGGPHPKIRAATTPHASRGVLVKGQAFPQVITLHTNLKKKQRVWLTVGGSCYDRGNPVYWTNWQRRITVPGRAAKGWNAEARSRVMSLRVNVSFPGKCFDNASLGTGDYVGDARVRVTKARPTTAGGVATSTQLFVGHPVSKANARNNLDIISSPTGAAGQYAVHRTLPAKHARRFAVVGLNVQDPRWTDWWCDRPGAKPRFRTAKGAYNARWNAFFRTTPKAGLHRILELQRRLDHEWGDRYRCG